jgi:hypothetical protein
MATLALLREEFRTLFKRRDSPTETAEIGFSRATADYNRADHVRDPFTHITVWVGRLGCKLNNRTVDPTQLNRDS